jgi:acid phosphatase type 7
MGQDLPLMTLPGNHEAEDHSPGCIINADCRDGLRNFTAYNARFRMPSPESDGSLNMWSSFNAGPVHFVSMDLETGYPGR